MFRVQRAQRLVAALQSCRYIAAPELNERDSRSITARCDCVQCLSHTLGALRAKAVGAAWGRLACLPHAAETLSPFHGYLLPVLRKPCTT